MPGRRPRAEEVCGQPFEHSGAAAGIRSISIPIFVPHCHPQASAEPLGPHGEHHHGKYRVKLVSATFPLQGRRPKAAARKVLAPGSSIIHGDIWFGARASRDATHEGARKWQVTTYGAGVLMHATALVKVRRFSWARLRLCATGWMPLEGSSVEHGKGHKVHLGRPSNSPRAWSNRGRCQKSSGGRLRALLLYAEHEGWAKFGRAQVRPKKSAPNPASDELVRSGHTPRPSCGPRLCVPGVSDRRRAPGGPSQAC